MFKIDNERMIYLQKFYDNQLVSIEIPAVSYQTTKGTVIHRFSGVRCGVKFHDGFASVQKKDVHKFEHQHYIIHFEREGN